MSAIEVKHQVLNVLDTLSEAEAGQVLDFALELQRRNGSPQGVNAEKSERKRGTLESWRQTFEEMDKSGGIDDAEWARVEAEMKAADTADMEKTLEQIRRLLGH